MKKVFTSLLMTSLVISSIHAQTVANNDMYNGDFSKMNKYFNSLMQSSLNASRLNNLGYPRTNIENKKDKITLKFDLAGVEKKNIKLSINDDKILTVEGSKEERKEENSSNYVQKEIFHGSFKKSIQLPQNIDQSKLETSYKNGILTVVIEKKEIKKPKARIIPIK